MTSVSTYPQGGEEVRRPAKESESSLGLDRVLPNSIEAETCVLGSMILDGSAVDIVVQFNQADHFLRPAHQLIFQALVDMRQQLKPVDLVTLREELLARRQLETVGGIEYIADLVEGVPNSANAEYYAKIVRDKAMCRELIHAGNDIIRSAYENREDAATQVDQAERQIFKIASGLIGQEAVGLRGLIDRTFEMIENTQGQALTGLGTGFPKLDEITAGLQNGEMIILGARPSMGKTSLLLNLAEHISIVDGQSVAFFSLEMSNQQIAQRLLASHAGFDLRQMRRGMIGAEDWTRLKNAAGPLYEAPLYIDDTPTLTILQLRAKARRLKASYGIKAIFLDYLQLMSYSGPSGTSRQEQITEISRGIKALARELSVPVVAAAQLNRGPADRPNQRPKMSDLRESGSIEQDADVIMLLHNEDYYHIGDPDYQPTGQHELIIAKQRNGPTDVVPLIFLKQFTRFQPAASFRE